MDRISPVKSMEETNRQIRQVIDPERESSGESERAKAPPTRRPHKRSNAFACVWQARHVVGFHKTPSYFGANIRTGVGPPSVFFALKPVVLAKRGRLLSTEGVTT